MGRTGKYGKYKKRKLGAGVYLNAHGKVFAHTRRRSGYEAEFESDTEPDTYDTPDERDHGHADPPLDSQADLFDTQADVETYVDTQADLFDSQMPDDAGGLHSPDVHSQEDLSPPPTPEPVPKHANNLHKRRPDTSSSDEGLAVSPVRGLSPVRIPDHAPQLPAWAGPISEDELPPTRERDGTVYLTDAEGDPPAPSDESEV